MSGSTCRQLEGSADFCDRRPFSVLIVADGTGHIQVSYMFYYWVLWWSKCCSTSYHLEAVVYIFLALGATHSSLVQHIVRLTIDNSGMTFFLRLSRWLGRCVRHQSRLLMPKTDASASQRQPRAPSGPTSHPIPVGTKTFMCK